MTQEKIEMYYSSFKNTCRTISISPIEFELIFNSDISTYKIWDRGGREFVDSFMLFSGLIMCSRNNFFEKLEMLFQIFDFNQDNRFDKGTFKFIINSIFNFYKLLYGIETEIEYNQISNYVEKYFTGGGNLKIGGVFKALVN